MPDKSKVVSKKETVVKTVVKSSKTKKESKAEAFLRIAESRVKFVLNSLRILGNCSNRGNYEYSSEQIETMRTSLQKSLDNVFAKFTPSKLEQETFKF